MDLSDLTQLHDNNSARAYPSGFGENLRRAFEQHLGNGPGKRDLRFKVQANPLLGPVEMFQWLPMGDLWDDANLLEPLAYCMTSKHLRRDDMLS